MRDFSSMDTGTENESSLSEDEDGLEVQPTSPDDDDPGYRPSDSHSSSEKDESNCVHCRPRKTKKHVEAHGEPVILKPRHLGANTDLAVGTMMSRGETLELDNGSLLKITSFGKCVTYVRGIGEQLKSRLVTFEEVRGVLNRHRQRFQAVVPGLTTTGSSIRWRVLECADHGVPQRRKRLFMIASW